MVIKHFSLILLASLTFAGCVSQTITPDQPRIATGKSASANLTFAQQYLAQVKQQPGIQTTSTGLAYRVLKTGYGCKPTSDSAITIFYQAQVADGMKIIDSNYSRGRPDTFPLNRMIAAWREALPMMAEGSRWELYTPPRLAYGSKGAGRDVPPNAAMVFTVELLKAGTCAMSFKRG